MDGICPSLCVPTFFKYYFQSLGIQVICIVFIVFFFNQLYPAGVFYIIFFLFVCTVHFWLNFLYFLHLILKKITFLYFCLSIISNISVTAAFFSAIYFHYDIFLHPVCGELPSISICFSLTCILECQELTGHGHQSE